MLKCENLSSHRGSELGLVGAFPCVPYALPLSVPLCVFLHTNLVPFCILTMCLVSV